MLESLGIKKSLEFMKTKGFLVRNIDPYTDNKRLQKRIAREMRRNPWYTFRTYFQDMSAEDVLPQDISSVYSIFSGINTWVETNQRPYKNHDSILKSLLSLSLRDPKSAHIIFVPNERDVERVTKRLQVLSDRLPKHVIEEDRLKVFVVSAFNVVSVISYIKLFDTVTVLDLELHRNIDLFFYAHTYYKHEDKTFILSSLELPTGDLNHKFITIANRGNHRKIYWTEDLFALHRYRLKAYTNGNFLTHKYFY